MAAPSPKTFTMPAGHAFYGGMYSPPTWSQGVQTRTWTEIPNSSFLANAGSIITPPSGYLGSNPIASIMDAYCDPIENQDGTKLYFFGGGHLDGSCNALLEMDTRQLAFAQTIPPTPPSKYPPSFTAPNSVIAYPSGLTPGYFSATLTNPLDTPYNAPQNAPGASHQYTANALRGNKIHYFYGGYKECDISSHTWGVTTGVDIGAQLYANNPNYSNKALQQGTAAVYDPITDKMLVTLVPGDDGLSWRVGFFLFDPVTKLISNIVTGSGIARSAMTLVRIGRYAYATCIDLNYGGPGVETTKGWRFNFDTKVLEHFVTVGDQITMNSASVAETVPANYHPVRNTLIRWNYENEKAALYEMSLTPSGGAGTLVSPYTLQQTRIPIAGTPPASVLLNYRRLYFVPGSDCMLFLPRASSNLYAVKL